MTPVLPCTSSSHSLKGEQVQREFQTGSNWGSTSLLPQPGDQPELANNPLSLCFLLQRGHRPHPGHSHDTNQTLRVQPPLYHSSSRTLPFFTPALSHPVPRKQQDELKARICSRCCTEQTPSTPGPALQGPHAPASWAPSFPSSLAAGSALPTLLFL